MERSGVKEPPKSTANDAAIAAGIFGAPCFVIDGEPFWGNDRKPQIERWLAQGVSRTCSET